MIQGSMRVSKSPWKRRGVKGQRAAIPSDWQASSARCSTVTKKTDNTMLAADVLKEAAIVRLMATHMVAANAVINTDRKSTRLNSSHVSISYAVFCLKKKIT